MNAYGALTATDYLEEKEETKDNCKEKQMDGMSIMSQFSSIQRCSQIFVVRQQTYTMSSPICYQWAIQEKSKQGD